MNEKNLLDGLYYLSRLKNPAEQVVLQNLQNITTISSLIDSKYVIRSLEDYIENHNVNNELKTFIKTTYSINC